MKPRFDRYKKRAKRHRVIDEVISEQESQMLEQGLIEVCSRNPLSYRMTEKGKAMLNQATPEDLAKGNAALRAEIERREGK